MRSSKLPSAAALLAAATAITPPTSHATTNLIAKRESPKVFAARAWNSDGAYQVNTTLGTPGQPLSLLLDINATQHTLNYASGTRNCSLADEESQCAQFGAYYPNASSTWAYGERYLYEWDKDEWLVLFGKESDLLTMGTEGSERTLNVSVYPGSGFSDSIQNVMAASGNASGISILNDLVDADIIDARAFSLWNNPAVDQESEVLFGGVNIAQYRGKLTTYDLNEDSVPCLPVSSLQVTSTEEENGSNITIEETQFTISTSKYTILPKDVTDQLYSAYNITERFLPCSRMNENRTVSLSIGNTTITTPWRYLLYRLAGSDPDSEQCIFGPWDGGDVAGDERAIIGVEFLRNMFLAIDYDKGKVGFAELSTAPGEDDVRSLEDAEGVQGSGGDAGFEDGESEDDGDTGAAGRMSIPGFGMLAVVGGIAFALL
ncbi:aspartic peptidase domain-containing protein [Aspergillus venezuelensis]